MREKLLRACDIATGQYSKLNEKRSVLTGCVKIFEGFAEEKLRPLLKEGQSGDQKLVSSLPPSPLFADPVCSNTSFVASTYIN